MQLPTYVSEHLWDTNPKNLSPTKHSSFIIERILEYGDKDSVKWMEKNFARQEIIDVLKKSNKISPKTGNFFALFYRVPKEELLCIRKPFTQKQNRF